MTISIEMSKHKLLLNPTGVFCNPLARNPFDGREVHVGVGAKVKYKVKGGDIFYSVCVSGMRVSSSNDLGDLGLTLNGSEVDGGGDGGLC